MVAHAHGNWSARLALTALGVQLHNSFFLVPKNACQECFRYPNPLTKWAWVEKYLIVY